MRLQIFRADIFLADFNATFFCAAHYVNEPLCIIFSLAGSQTTVTAGTLNISELSRTSSVTDLNDDILLTLDPHLRPATPDFEDPRSVEMYEEHKQLAKEYLKVSEPASIPGHSRNWSGL